MQEANPPCRSADNKADRDTAGKLPSEWRPVSLPASVYRLHRPLIYPLIAESCPELRISQITVQGMSPGAGECQWQSQGQRRAVVVPRLAHVEHVFVAGPHNACSFHSESLPGWSEAVRSETHLCIGSRMPQATYWEQLAQSPRRWPGNSLGRWPARAGGRVQPY